MTQSTKNGIKTHKKTLSKSNYDIVYNLAKRNLRKETDILNSIAIKSILRGTPSSNIHDSLISGVISIFY